jgi:hypothetical protein
MMQIPQMAIAVVMARLIAFRASPVKRAHGAAAVTRIT